MRGSGEWESGFPPRPAPRVPVLCSLPRPGSLTPGALPDDALVAGFRKHILPVEHAEGQPWASIPGRLPIEKCTNVPENKKRVEQEVGFSARYARSLAKVVDTVETLNNNLPLPPPKKKNSTGIRQLARCKLLHRDNPYELMTARYPASCTDWDAEFLGYGNSLGCLNICQDPETKVVFFRFF